MILTEGKPMKLILFLVSEWLVHGAYVESGELWYSCVTDRY